MKVFCSILTAAATYLVSAVLAEPPVGSTPGPQYLPISSGYRGSPAGRGGGYSYDAPQEDNAPANYEYEYHVVDAVSGNDFGHKESRQGDVAQGRYSVLLPDGRTQIVEYVADQEGYRPRVRYEGVANDGYNYDRPGVSPGYVL